MIWETRKAVRFPFLFVLPLRLALGFGAEFFQILKPHGFRADEPAFEVGVNRPRGLGGLVPLSDAPRLDLVAARGEEVNQVDHGKRGFDDFRQHRLHLLIPIKQSVSLS